MITADNLIEIGFKCLHETRLRDSNKILSQEWYMNSEEDPFYVCVEYDESGIKEVSIAGEFIVNDIKELSSKWQQILTIAK
jgi:hypothetical protein